SPCICACDRERTPITSSRPRSRGWPEPSATRCGSRERASRRPRGSCRAVIAVLDYGIGNLRSAQKALERVGADAVLTDDVDVVAAATAVVLPGVGAFGRSMKALRATGLEKAALAAIDAGTPFLGICIGMQL